MADPHVITALVKRRAELAGQIEATHEALRKMVLDLENLDVTIQQLDPNYQVEAIRPKAFRRTAAKPPAISVRFGSDSDFMSMSAVRQLAPQNRALHLTAGISPWGHERKPVDSSIPF
jgi:hypothetical protein